MARSKEISMAKLKIAISRLFQKMDEWMQVQSTSQVATLNQNPSCSSSPNSDLADPSQTTDTSCPSRSYLDTNNSPPVFDPPLTRRDDCIFSKVKDQTIIESSIDDVVVDHIDKRSNVANPMILETVIEKEIERICEIGGDENILQNGKESDEETPQMTDKESVVVDFPTEESCFKKESGCLHCLERKIVSRRMVGRLQRKVVEGMLILPLKCLKKWVTILSKKSIVGLVR